MLEPVCFDTKNDVLLRKWRPPYESADEDWAVHHQVVVLESYRQEIISMAHNTPLSGHPGWTRHMTRYCNTSTGQTWRMMRGNSSGLVTHAKWLVSLTRPFLKLICNPLPPLRNHSAEYLLIVLYLYQKHDLERSICWLSCVCQPGSLKLCHCAKVWKRAEQLSELEGFHITLLQVANRKLHYNNSTPLYRAVPTWHNHLSQPTLHTLHSN